MTRRKSKFHACRVRQLEGEGSLRGRFSGLRGASVGLCRFPLWARLKYSSPSDGIQSPVVACQDLRRPAQGFQGAGHEADGDTAMTRRKGEITGGDVGPKYFR
jgi:hypothetical protein